MQDHYYKLTDEDNEAIDFYNKTFREINDLGFYILDNVLNVEDKLPNFLIPIRSMLYRLLELNDTLNVMVQNSLINTAFPILRNEFEIFVQILYLLDENDTKEEKALLYHYCNIRRINNRLDKEKLDNFLEKHYYLLDIHKKYHANKLVDKRAWYEIYHNKITTLKHLCSLIDEQENYEKIYNHLSAYIHGNGCLELNTAFFEDDNKYYLLHFRHFERHHGVMIYHIDFFRKTFRKIISVFETNIAIKDKIDSFYKRAGQYIECYHSIKENSFLDPYSQYSI